MTQMPDFDRQITAWLEAAGPADPPDGLVDRALAKARRTRRRSALAARVLGPTPWPASRLREWAPSIRAALLVALTLAAVAGAAAVGSRLLAPPRLSQIAPSEAPPASPASTSGIVPTEAPPVSPGPTLDVGEVIHGWPSTGGGPAGWYSWGGDPRCHGSCIHGFMHNGYGSGDVRITIRAAVRPVSDEGAAAVTVAGHDATYRRVDERKERWVVEIGGTQIVIIVQANAGTSEDDLAEAHSIIESMRVEPRETRRGFRLVFRLPTDDWDSG